MNENIKDLEYRIHAKSKPFQKKLLDTKHLITRVLNKYGKMYVSWSGGKDSTIVAHMAHSIKPGIQIMHIKSGYALPDCYEYMQEVSRLWGMNLIEIPTPVDYLELCKEFGLPHMRTRDTEQAAIRIVKKSPASEWAKQNGFHGLLWGIRAEESKGRLRFSKFRGKLFVGKNGFVKISPVLDWSVRDIFAYFAQNNLPINPIYLKENCGMTRETIRNSGWLTTTGENQGRLVWLKRNYPEQYEQIKELL